MEQSVHRPVRMLIAIAAHSTASGGMFTAARATMTRPTRAGDSPRGPVDVTACDAGAHGGNVHVPDRARDPSTCNAHPSRDRTTTSPARNVHPRCRALDCPARVTWLQRATHRLPHANQQPPLANRPLPHGDVALPPNIAETAVPVWGRRSPEQASLPRTTPESFPEFPEKPRISNSGRDRIGRMCFAGTARGRDATDPRP